MLAAFLGYSVDTLKKTQEVSMTRREFIFGKRKIA